MTERPDQHSMRRQARHAWRTTSGHRPLGTGKGRDKSARLPRLAALTTTERQNATGTLLLTFRVIDDQPWDFTPGQFVAIDMEHPTYGYRRSPYCIHSPPTGYRGFQLLVRVVPEGPVSLFLGDLQPGDTIGLRGPSGHSMLPHADDDELVMIATGVGVGPFHSLLECLAAERSSLRMRLFCGLRFEKDICLTKELDDLVARLLDFRYEITPHNRVPSGVANGGAPLKRCRLLWTNLQRRHDR